MVAMARLDPFSPMIDDLPIKNGDCQVRFGMLQSFSEGMVKLKNIRMEDGWIDPIEQSSGEQVHGSVSDPHGFV